MPKFSVELFSDGLSIKLLQTVYLIVVVGYILYRIFIDNTDIMYLLDTLIYGLATGFIGELLICGYTKKELDRVAAQNKWLQEKFLGKERMSTKDLQEAYKKHKKNMSKKNKKNKR